MAPAEYQAAAQAVYQPQQQADTIALQTQDATTKTSLEAEKGQVSTDYQDAIDKLTQSVQDQSSQINQLYTERLGGNFSGLQGNDLGQMFSRANDQQSIIGQTRANKLAEITAGETNADIEMNSGIAALTPKYQSLEAQYADSAYSADEKAAQAQANSDRSYELSVAKFENSASNSASSANNSYLSGFKAIKGQGANGGYAYTGPNGEGLNLGQYADQLGQGDAGNTLDLIKNQLQNGTGSDQTILSTIRALGKNGMSDSDVIGYLKNASAKKGTAYYANFNGAF